MKEITLKLYRYEELSQEVKDKLIEKNRQETGDWLCEVRYDEYQSSLEKFCEVFGIKMLNYEASAGRTYYNFRVKDVHPYSCDFYLEDLSGIRLHTYFMNNIYDDCIKGKYYSKTSSLST